MVERTGWTPPAPPSGSQSCSGRICLPPRSVRSADPPHVGPASEHGETHGAGLWLAPLAGLEPATYGLEDSSEPSTAYCPVPSLRVRSDGSSSQYGAVVQG
jgi:hypothetical protein